MGAGNPPNPNGHRTAYLWEWVWQRDAWLDLLQRFVHVEPLPKGSKARPTVIFPRYHQWDAVLALTADAQATGPGHDYLVQNSAGSGKSNTIAWTAHRLSSLHVAGVRKVFDKVVVVTDRRVLDKQLQATIYQFEHAHGVVVRIDDNSQRRLPRQPRPPGARARHLRAADLRQGQGRPPGALHDICRVHVDPCGFPVDAVVVHGRHGQHVKATEFYVRVANGTRALDDVEKQKYVEQRWGSGA